LPKRFNMCGPDLVLYHSGGFVGIGT